MKMCIADYIGKKIREMRSITSITRRELGDNVYLSPYSIANYEVGRRTPDIETLCHIADYFGLTLDELVGRVPPKEQKRKTK